ncbi:hypothetical protein EBQ26_10420 [Allofranklinella schreckenbergeri]|uniref:Uncharacterized protein n=1 Tax=Allofranklinella schreckenbergeri TaxID=1076744 RepID=A0A3M6PY88_9BURK|nr:hypothetical protein [Allofranklinella schreckenbergeri]RMW96013.1 hypothetical protein EBQ26_10420 [Allofranklinella schreckenbergeri]
MQESALARAEAASAGHGALTTASARQIAQAAHAIHNWGSHTHVHIYVQAPPPQQKKPASSHAGAGA